MWYNSFGKVLGLVLLVFFLLAALAFGLLFYGQYHNLTTPENANTNTSNINTRLSVNTSTLVTPDADDDPYLGPVDAPVEIIAFEDFQCPYCEAEEPILKELLAKYPNDIKFVYRDFPLYTIHDYAISAAQAGECADAQGKFWAWHDQAYANQSALAAAPAVYSIWAQTAGLDLTAFETCVEQELYAGEVQKDQDEGILAGVNATPTFFVNGEKIEGTISLSDWETIVKAALAN
jgi:protein-disulfide isomerase